MAQLRQDYGTFVDRQTEIAVIGPEKKKAFKKYWARETLPFVGLPDPRHTVSKLYGQEVNLFRLGRMPALVVIDKYGLVRLAHYGSSMKDIPGNASLVAIIDNINGN